MSPVQRRGGTDDGGGNWVTGWRRRQRRWSRTLPVLTLRDRVLRQPCAARHAHGIPRTSRSFPVQSVWRQDRRPRRVLSASGSRRTRLTGCSRSRLKRYDLISVYVSTVLSPATHGSKGRWSFSIVRSLLSSLGVVSAGVDSTVEDDVYPLCFGRHELLQSVYLHSSYLCYPRRRRSKKPEWICLEWRWSSWTDD